MTKRDRTNDDRITAREVASRLGIHPNSVRRVALANAITRFEIRGTDPRYLASDVERVRQASVKVGH